MLGILLALLAATGWALSAVLARVGLQSIKPSFGTLISLVAGFTLVATVAALVDLESLVSVPLGAVLWFAMVGVLNFPMGRFFNYQGISRIGVSKATPVMASAPLFAITIAVIFTGESLTPLVVAGAITILLGLVLVVTEGER
jgi:drug/metabolite transporter, DME family